MAEELLTIQRLRLECSTSAEAQPSQVQDDLERTARTVLGPATERVLDQAMPAAWRGSGSIVYLPKLEVTLDIDTSIDRDAVARVWGRVIAAEVLRAIARPDVLRFEDEPTRLAAFLVDLLHGRAWHSALWRDFDGLKPLDLSVALRTALLRDISQGLTACRVLRPADLHSCLAALRSEDAGRVLDAFWSAPPSRPVPRALDSLARVAVSSVPILPLSARQGLDHFVLALLVTRQETVIQMLALGPRRVRALAALVLDHLAPGLGHQPPQALAEAVQRTSSPVSEALGVLDPEEGRAVSAAVARAAGVAKAEIQSDPLEERATPFGGAFLLWPHIQALPWDRLFPDADLDVICAAQEAVLARALGAELPYLRHDAAVAFLFATTPVEQSAVPLINAADLAQLLNPWFSADGADDALWCEADPLWCRTSASHGYWMEVTDRPPRTTTETKETESATVRTDAATVGLTLDAPLVPWLAQIVCKRLAYRLPGFANATVGFLRQNILPMAASVRVDEEGAVQVTLDHPPLGIMLNLTGLARQRYEVASGKPVQLVQGDQG